MDNDRDLVFLKHIFDETGFLLSTCKGKSIEELKEDGILQRAVQRSLEIIGEAVKNLSRDFKEEHLEIEWKKIAGLRDKLIHHYFGVDWDIVWDILQNKIPELHNQIETILDE